MLLLRRRHDGLVRLDPGRPYTAGRESSVDLHFDDDAVSRLHVTLKPEGQGWLVIDQQSANGTYAAPAPDDASMLADDDVRAALFGQAREVAGGDATPLDRGTVIFLGGADAALVPIDEPTLGASAQAVDGSWASDAGRQLQQALERAARARGPVLLVGASGSGKTHAARAVHAASGRAGRFVALNAAALPEDPAQLRSALLGHKKGAFTGADRDVLGAWFAADQGTLFLDEVDSLPPAGQAFLLTLLEQTADLLPLGAPVGCGRGPGAVRVVAASKTSLKAAGLRDDLAYRLVDGTILELPSLAERREDIPAFVHALLEALAEEDGSAVPFTENAIALCQGARWPGEVRQLRGLVRHLAREAALDGYAVVDEGAVRDHLLAQERALGHTGFALPRQQAEAGEPDGAASKNPRHMVKEDILAALDAEGGNIQRAADRLGVARGTFVAKMDRFGVPRPGKR